MGAMPDFAAPGEAVEAIWPLLLELAALRRAGDLGSGCAVRRLDDVHFACCQPGDPRAVVSWSRDGGWQVADGLPDAERRALALYLPLCTPCTGRPWVMAQLGQSIDGRIATQSGDSCYVSGAEGLTHLHRLRALCDAVLVGANTAATDNPRLTTRRVAGANPLRVVLDPRGRLDGQLHVFTDGEAPTLVVGSGNGHSSQCAGIEYVQVPERGGRLDLDAVLVALARRGVRALLVEGGGVTVSAFLEANLLDRLHLVVAPLLIGSGRAGLTLPPVDRLSGALRPAARIYRLGADVLWDFDMRANATV